MDPRNDGYVLWTDQVIPGATLLGYVNLDHYDIALPVRERLNIGGQKGRHEARMAVFEAMLLTVSEALSGSRREFGGVGAAPWIPDRRPSSDQPPEGHSGHAQPR
jgi:hypothetical protein